MGIIRKESFWKSIRIVVETFEDMDREIELKDIRVKVLLE